MYPATTSSLEEPSPTDDRHTTRAVSADSKVSKPKRDDNYKRASLPFEVKLSPSVTKRMSLDAFGAQISDRPSIGDDQRSMEELVEDEIAHDEEAARDAEAARQMTVAQSLEGFQATPLTTIDESPDMSSSIGSGIETPASFACFDRTRYFTPVTPSQLPEFPLPPLYSTPPHQPRRHLSAPPLGITQTLLNVQSGHNAALQEKVREGEGIIELLKDEMEALREELQLQRRKEVQETEEELAELTRSLQAKDKGQYDLRSFVIPGFRLLTVVSNRGHAMRDGRERRVLRPTTTSSRRIGQPVLATRSGEHRAPTRVSHRHLAASNF